MAGEQRSSLRGRLAVTLIDGKHWLQLVDDDGAALLRGGPHRSLAEISSAIARLRDGSAVWRARMTATGEYYFCVMDDQGEVLGTSTMYVAASDRDRALTAAQVIAPTASLVVPSSDRGD